MTNTAPKNTTIPTYNQNKDTRIPWLGKIPAHWEVMKLKFIANVYNGDSLNVEQKRKFSKKSDNSVPYISTKEINISDNSVNYNTGISIPKKLSYKIAQKNSSLLCIEGGSAGKKLTFLNKEVAFVNKLAAIKPINNKNCDKFLFYSLQSQFFKSQFNIALSGLIGGVTITEINNVSFTVPPKPEQIAIADFLDHKTTQIDQAIAQKQALIDRLKTYKQVLIQQAVTKGLNPNAPLKDSGVEWIGQIPVHWEVKYGFTFLSEIKRNNIGLKENKVLSLSYGKIIVKPSNKLFGLIPESFETYQIVEPNDIIIRSTDLQNDKKSLRVGISNIRGIITSAYLNLSMYNLDVIPKYIYFFLYYLDVSKVLYRFGSGLRQNLSYDDFKRMKFPIPPKNEQEEIVKYIEVKTTQIDRSIALQEAEIKRLQTYKTVLIDQAVTGKIKLI